MKDRFYEELEHVFDKFPKYPMKILLGEFNAKVDKEDILKPGKRPICRPRRRWVDSIKIDLKEIGWDDMDWIDLAPDRD
jgi:hypothetical protein